MRPAPRRRPPLPLPRRLRKPTSCACNIRPPARHRATSSVPGRTVNPTSAAFPPHCRSLSRRLPLRQPTRAPSRLPAPRPSPPNPPAIPIRPMASRLGALRDNGLLLRADAAQPERWSGHAFSRLGLRSHPAAGNSLSGLRPAVFSRSRLSGNAAAGGRVSVADAAEPGRRSRHRSPDRTGAGLAVEEPARHVWHLQDAGGIFCRFDRRALQRGEHFHPSDSVVLLLLLPPVAVLGDAADAARPTAPFRLPELAPVRRAERSGRSVAVPLPGQAPCNGLTIDAFCRIALDFKVFRCPRAPILCESSCKCCSMWRCITWR